MADVFLCRDRHQSVHPHWKRGFSSTASTGPPRADATTVARGDQIRMAASPPSHYCRLRRNQPQLVQPLNAWRDAADGLRRAHFVECEAIAVQLVDNEEIVADSAPTAQWLPKVMCWPYAGTWNWRTRASHPLPRTMLGRQDLLKDLRLVLGSLSGRGKSGARTDRGGVGAGGD